MALSPRLQNYLSEVSKEQEKISNHIQTLHSDGILDDSLDAFLKNSYQELEKRKKNLLQDLASTSQFSKIPVSVPLIPVSVNPIQIKKKPTQEIFQSEKPHSSLFRQKTSPDRGSSPSACRYSPKANNVFEKYEKPDLKPIEKKISRESPIGSTRSSRSSEDKILPENIEFGIDELKIKYQEQREIRNKAQEQMLMIREKMLHDKETYLKNIIKKAASSPDVQRNNNKMSENSPKGKNLAETCFFP